MRQVNSPQGQLPEPWQELVGQVPSSAIGWERYLKNVLQAAYAGAKGLVKSLELPIVAPSPSSRFPLLDTGSEVMLCHRVFPDWQAALRAFGQAEHAFRRENPRARTAFGCANPRWASPLWVRVLPVNGGVVLALTLLWSQPPPRVRANRNDLRRFIKRYADEWDGRWLIRQEVAQ